MFALSLLALTVRLRKRDAVRAIHNTITCGFMPSEALHLLLFECEMASVFKACQQSVTSHGEFIMARVVKRFIRPAVNNEPC